MIGRKSVHKSLRSLGGSQGRASMVGT